MLVIKNGTIIDPERNRTYRGDLWIEGGIIRKIVEKGSLEAEVSARDGDDGWSRTDRYARPFQRPGIHT